MSYIHVLASHQFYSLLLTYLNSYSNSESCNTQHMIVSHVEDFTAFREQRLHCHCTSTLHTNIIPSPAQLTSTKVCLYWQALNILTVSCLLGGSCGRVCARPRMTRKGEGNLRTCQSWTGSTCNPHNGTGSLWSRSALELSDVSDALIGSRAWDMGSWISLL